MRANWQTREVGWWIHRSEGPEVVRLLESEKSFCNRAFVRCLRKEMKKKR